MLVVEGHQSILVILGDQASYWLEPDRILQPEVFFFHHYAGAYGFVWIRLSTLLGLASACDWIISSGALPTISAAFRSHNDRRRHIGTF